MEDGIGKYCELKRDVIQYYGVHIPAGTICRAFGGPRAFRVYFEKYKPDARLCRDYFYISLHSLKFLSPLEILAKES